MRHPQGGQSLLELRLAGFHQNRQYQNSNFINFTFIINLPSDVSRSDGREDSSSVQARHKLRRFRSPGAGMLWHVDQHLAVPAKRIEKTSSPLGLNRAVRQVMKNLAGKHDGCRCLCSLGKALMHAWFPMTLGSGLVALMQPLLTAPWNGPERPTSRRSAHLTACTACTCLQSSNYQHNHQFACGVAGPSCRSAVSEGGTEYMLLKWLHQNGRSIGPSYAFKEKLHLATAVRRTSALAPSATSLSPAALAFARAQALVQKVALPSIEGGMLSPALCRHTRGKKCWPEQGKAEHRGNNGNAQFMVSTHWAQMQTAGPASELCRLSTPERHLRDVIRRALTCMYFW